MKKISHGFSIEKRGARYTRTDTIYLQDSKHHLLRSKQCYHLNFYVKLEIVVSRAYSRPKYYPLVEQHLFLFGFLSFCPFILIKYIYLTERFCSCLNLNEIK